MNNNFMKSWPKGNVRQPTAILWPLGQFRILNTSEKLGLANYRRWRSRATEITEKWKPSCYRFGNAAQHDHSRNAIQCKCVIKFSLVFFPDKNIYITKINTTPINSKYLREDTLSSHNIAEVESITDSDDNVSKRYLCDLTLYAADCGCNVRHGRTALHHTESCLQVCVS